MKEFIINNLIKVRAYKEGILNFEIFKKGFTNKDSFLINSKSTLIQDDFKCVKDEYNFILFYKECKFIIPINAKSLNKLRAYDKNNNLIYKYKFIRNNGELPLPYIKKDIFPLMDNPKIILNDNYLMNELENILIDENYIDLYLLIYKKNHQLLKKQYISLTGRSNLVRFKTLGLWNSRYYKYNDKEIISLIDKYGKYDLPIDNFVVDTDWRKASERGIGYEVNTDLFPDIKEFFNDVHNKKIEVMFNDHPEPLNNKSIIFNKKELIYRKEKLTNLLNEGLDYWWYDRNWTTHLNSLTKHINQETFGDYVFYTITQDYFKDNKNSKYSKRSVIMSNANDIRNGEYKGIKDSASHRYSFNWTGDISSSLESLYYEIKNLILGNNSEITYLSSDLGGHTGNPTKEEYIRWMQFGVFSPIFRPHSTKDVIRYREPWNYDLETINIFRNLINLRYRLLPYLYSLNYLNYQEGIPTFKHLSYFYNDKKVNTIFNEYIFGNNILVSPYGDKETTKLKKSDYTSKVKATFFNNVNFEGEPILIKEYDEINFYTNNEPIEIGIPVYNVSIVFETTLKFKKDITLYVSSDDGCIIYLNNKLVYEDKNFHSITKNKVIEIKKNEEVNLRINYFQGGGEACLSLTKKINGSDKHKVYIPNDNFINLFTGEMVTGGKYLYFNKNKDLYSFPLFIKEGSLIYYVQEAKRTDYLDYSKLYIEYFPSFTEKDEVIIYEDDHQTLAYKDNINQISKISASYEKEDNCFVIKMFKTVHNNNYITKTNEREIFFKFHLNNVINKIAKVTLNGNEIDFSYYKKNPDNYVFSATNDSNTSDIVLVKFNENIEKNDFLKFYFS